MAAPANDKSIPTIGFFPRLRNINAAKGGSTINPASPTPVNISPINITVKYIRLLGTFFTTTVRRHSKKPLLSASPIPIIATSTTPKGGYV